MKKRKFAWKKDWPWIALAAIAVGVFFLRTGAPAPNPHEARGTVARGRGTYATGKIRNGGTEP